MEKTAKANRKAARAAKDKVKAKPRVKDRAKVRAKVKVKAKAKDKPDLNPAAAKQRRAADQNPAQRKAAIKRPQSAPADAENYKNNLPKVLAQLKEPCA